MVTNYPRFATSHPVAHPVREEVGAQSSEGFLDRVLRIINELLCGWLHGHDFVLHFEHNRMCLRCTSCSYHSPGWEMDLRRPRLRFRGDRRRHLPTRRPALVASKTA